MKDGLLKISAITLVLSCSLLHAHEAASISPMQKPGFAASITGLYLRPSASNLVYAIHTTPLPLQAPNWQQEVVNPGYSGAFDLGLQYNLINGRDSVKFDWLHFQSRDYDSANSSPDTSVGPIYYFGPTEQFLLNTRANSTVKFNIDDTRLVFGRLINLADNIQVEPFFGLSGAYLKEKISDHYSGTDPIEGPYTHDVYVKSTFTGIGPRIGFNGSYFMTDRFAIVGGVAGNLLAGVLKYKTDFTSWTADIGDTPHNNTPTNTKMADQNVNRIVPEIDAKIAMLYKVAFDKSCSELVIQVGYMYSVYFNAVNQVLPSTLVPGAWESGTVAIVTQSEKQSNVDLRGPFVSATWKF